MIQIHIDSSEDEFIYQVSRKIIAMGLSNRTRVTTGFLCVGMSQTLTHRLTGTFTSAIIGIPPVSADDISQLVARCFGITKGWRTYFQTKVYCPTKIRDQVAGLEACIINFMNSDLESFTHQQFIEPLQEYYPDVIPHLKQPKVAKPIKQDLRKTVPRFIELSQQELDTIESFSRLKDKNQARKQIVLHYFPDLLPFECVKISTPTEEKSYKRHITDLSISIEMNKPNCPDISPQYRDKSVYLIFNDYFTPRLFVVVWKGI
jgi:hypothetical protein